MSKLSPFNPRKKWYGPDEFHLRDIDLPYRANVQAIQYEAAYDWCVEHATCNFDISSGEGFSTNFHFDDQDTAALFKLTFGGK